LDQRGDDDRRFGRPSTVNGRPADAGPGGDALDGDTPVSVFLQELQGRLKDRLVVAGVAGSAWASRPTLGVPGGGILDRHCALLD